MLLALTCVALAATAVETEARQILDQILRVDTSHGNETAALQPVLARFQQAGIRAQILESAPGAFRTGAPRVWRALGLKHRPRGQASVLGWPIRRQTPELALLGADSHTGMPAQLLVWKPAPGELLFATLVQHRNGAMRALWAAMIPAHQRIVQELLVGARRRVGSPQQGARPT